MARIGIPSRAELGRSVEGVFKLMEGDSRGLALIDSSIEGLVRSFLAFIWCYPAQAFLWTAIWRELPQSRPETLSGTAGFLLVSGVADFLSWLLPALILYPASGLFGFRQDYVRLITATNWFGVVATYVAFLVASLRYLLSFSPAVGALATVATNLVILWFYFRVSRTSLSGDGLLAALVTATVLITSLFVQSAAFQILGIVP